MARKLAFTIGCALLWLTATAITVGHVITGVVLAVVLLASLAVGGWLGYLTSQRERTAARQDTGTQRAFSRSGPN